jgi:hypothetical protein
MGLEKLETLESYPLNEAKACIENYVNTGTEKGLSTDQIVKAFAVKAQDVVDALGISVSDTGELQFQHDYFRAYIGYEEKLVKEFKLFLVPAREVELMESDGSANALRQRKLIVDEIPVDNNGVQYVYDFNTPCPNSCDPKSPLYYRGN